MLSPGPTLAVVTRNAAAFGRGPGIATALGIGTANTAHAAASALGLSIALRQSPAAFDVIRIAGAAYLAWLGASGLWRLATRGAAAGFGRAERGDPARRPFGGFTQGVLTNLLHPPVAMFYLSYLPQFIKPTDPFLARYALLASVHVGLSTGWMSICAVAVDRLARVLRTPTVARVIEALAAGSLLVLGLALAMGR